jgi:signal peptidase
MRDPARAAWVPLIVASVAFAGWLVALATGHQTLVVMSGSMSPALSTGDVAIVDMIEPKEAEIGDIVTFRDPTRDEQLVTHRLVLIQRSGEDYAFVTKGDRNSSVEEWKIGEHGTIGRLSLRIPVIGRALFWLGTPGVRITMIAVTFLLLGSVAIRYALQLGRGVSEGSAVR